jgi:hypothetical protein
MGLKLQILKASTTRRVYDCCHLGGSRHHFAQQPQALRRQLGCQEIVAGCIGAVSGLNMTAARLSPGVIFESNSSRLGTSKAS